MFGAWEVYLFTLTRNKPSKPIISSAARSCLVHGDYTTLNFHLINSWEKYFHWGILDSHWHRARELARLKCQSRRKARRQSLSSRVAHHGWPLCSRLCARPQIHLSPTTSVWYFRHSPWIVLLVLIRKWTKFIPCLPAVRACLPAVRACLPTLRACLPAVRACLPAVRACLPTLRACLPAVRACLPVSVGEVSVTSCGYGVFLYVFRFHICGALELD